MQETWPLHLSCSGSPGMVFGLLYEFFFFKLSCPFLGSKKFFFALILGHLRPFSQKSWARGPVVRKNTPWEGHTLDGSCAKATSLHVSHAMNSVQAKGPPNLVHPTLGPHHLPTPPPRSPFHHPRCVAAAFPLAGPACRGEP